MITYLTILTISFLLLAIQQNKFKVTYKKRITCRLNLLFVEMLLLIFTIENPDYGTYNYIFSDNEVDFPEKGFGLVANLLQTNGIDNYCYISVLIGILVVLVFILWKNKIPGIHFTIFFYSLFAMYYDVIQIRNTISCFLMLASLCFFIDHKKIIAFALSFLALLFHRFALLMVFIMLYLELMDINKKTEFVNKGEFVFFVIVGMFGILKVKRIVRFLSEKYTIFEKLKDYIADDNGYDSLVIWAGTAVFFLAILWHFGLKAYLKDSFVSHERKRAVNILFRYSLFCIPLSSFLLVVNEFNRIYRFFYLIDFFIFGAVWKALNRKNTTVFLLISFVNIIFMIVAYERGLNFDKYW